MCIRDSHQELSWYKFSMKLSIYMSSIFKNGSHFDCWRIRLYSSQSKLNFLTSSICKISPQFFKRQHIQTKMATFLFESFQTGLLLKEINYIFTWGKFVLLSQKEQGGKQYYAKVKLLRCEFIPFSCVYSQFCILGADLLKNHCRWSDLIFIHLKGKP